MPKFIEDDDIVLNIKATKQFTDREEPRKVFWEKYNQMLNNMENNKNPIQVISYYGFGGIGKSSLLHKINEELDEQASNSKIEFIDFEKLVELNNNILDILKVIRQDLKDKYKFSFPIFDLVVYVYETKMGKTATKPELNSIFDENKELGFLKDVIGEIPLIGTFAKVIYYADAGRNMLQDRLKNRKLRERLLDIENSSIENIKEHLAYYFAMDLRENLKNEKAPFVFFIDTYEKLVNELSQIGDPLKNDLWLRADEGLICRTPNTLWVIAGREKLKWEELDSSWKGTLEQHLLGTLSFADTMQFLKTAGIENEDLIHQLYALTHGNPMYLDMCVDTYIKVAEKGKTPTIEDFGADTTKLIKRFLMYMNDTERDFSIMLAYVPEWTDETIEDISIKMNGTFSFSLYEKVKTFSFIVNENGKYIMHENVRDIIIANTPEIQKNKYQRILQEDTNIKLNEATKIEEKRISEIIQTENNDELQDEKIAFIDNYESKSAYNQVIQKLYLELFDEKDEELFNNKVLFLIEKINEYEDRFNEPIYFNDWQKVPFPESKYNKLLKSFNKYVTSEMIYEYYEELKELWGKYSEEAILPIKHNLRWDNIKFSEKEINPFLNAIESSIGKNNLYYISVYGLCEKSQETAIEFVKSIKEYNGSKNSFYMKLILRAASEYMLDQCYFKNTALTHEFYENYYLHEKDIAVTAMENFSIAINTLKENPDLLDLDILKRLYDVYVGFDMHKEKPLTSLLFEYIYSIRYIALKTSNQEVIDCFLRIFKEFIGGDDNEKNSISIDKILLSKTLDFLKELKLHYEELYGKDHYNVNEMEDFIDKFEDLTPAKLERIMRSKIERYGFGDRKSQRSLETYAIEVKNTSKSGEEAKAFFDIIFCNVKEMIKTFNKEELYEKSEPYKDAPIVAFCEWVENIKDCLEEICKDEYYNRILEIDSILYKYYDDSKFDAYYIASLIEYDITQFIEISSRLKDEAQITNAIRIVKDVIEHRYTNDCFQKPIIAYALYKVYHFINNKKINSLDYKELKDTYYNQIDTLEQVIKYELYENFGLSYEYEWTEKLFKMLSERDTNAFHNYDAERLEKFLKIIEDMKILYELYVKEYGEKSHKSILAQAYTGLLDIITFLKNGKDTLDKALILADSEDEDLKLELTEIKNIADTYIAIQKNSKSFNDLVLFDYTLSDLHNITDEFK